MLMSSSWARLVAMFCAALVVGRGRAISGQGENEMKMCRRGAGIGVETQIWDRWTGRIEYLYLQSGSISNRFAVNGGTLAVTKTVYDNVIRTVLNYHF
jgi:opacity protein-like surface antigen